MIEYRYDNDEYHKVLRTAHDYCYENDINPAGKGFDRFIKRTYHILKFDSRYFYFGDREHLLHYLMENVTVTTNVIKSIHFGLTK